MRRFCTGRSKMATGRTGPGQAKQPRARWWRALPTRGSSVAGPAPVHQSRRTRYPGSEPRCAATPRRPAARGAGTTPTCWRSRFAAPVRRFSPRSWTAGSRPRRATSTTTWQTSAIWMRLVSEAPLTAYLDSQGLGSGAIEFERIGEGHSNLTYLVRRHDLRVVLRRPPPPPLPPSAHDVLREARLLSALQDTAARTPRVLATCGDESVLGVPFYVMEEVAGSVITPELPPALDNPEERGRVGRSLVDALVEVHAVDWQAAGLEGFGKPTGYLERQLRRFGGLWEHNKTRELHVVQEVADWLAQNLPESPAATIVHGDYRLGNTMVANDPP